MLTTACWMEKIKDKAVAILVAPEREKMSIISAEFIKIKPVLGNMYYNP